MLRRMSKYENWSKEALINKITELENASLQNRVSSVPSPKPKLKKQKKMDFSKYSTRHVAIKIAYLGWNYFGLAHQNDDNTPTVESHILNAFFKTKCIPSMNLNECEFNRCGRTDRDVSAMEQVISLKLRSNLTKDEHMDPAMDSKELDYLKILNSHLPPDILAYQICLRPPPDFNARFSCKWRHYRYYFSPKDLNVEEMNEAAQLFLGEQDFRNFCKIDPAKQITNYRRTILVSEIVQVSPDLCYLSLRGTAFLWNQVRSIMAILFLVGQGLESKAAVSNMLNVELTPRRPAYEIAWGVPLVLYGCGYDTMEWKTSRYTSKDAIYNVWYDYWMKQSMAQTFIAAVSPYTTPDDRELSANVGKGVGRRSKYVPLSKRPVQGTFEEVNARWREKQGKKNGQ